MLRLPRAPFRLILSALLTLGAAAAQTAHVDRLLVCNKADSTLSVLDPAGGRAVAVLPTGDGPHEVAVSPDGRTAVVTDYGAQKPGHTLTVVDVMRPAVLRTIELTHETKGEDGASETKTFLRPHGVQFVDDHHVVVTSERARRLLLVDVTHGKVVRTWTTPQSSMHMVALSADKKRAVASSIADGNAVLFDLAGEAATPTAVVATGAEAEGLAVDPKTGAAWIGNRAADTLTVVDAHGKASAPIATAEFPFRVAFTPDGKHALVSCTKAGEVQVFDATTKELVRSISIHGDASELGAMPMGLCVDADGRRAYVACGRGEFVAVIDLQKGEVVDRFVAGRGPDGITCARFAATPRGEAVIR